LWLKSMSTTVRILVVYGGLSSRRFYTPNVSDILILKKTAFLGGKGPELGEEYTSPFDRYSCCTCNKLADYYRHRKLVVGKSRIYIRPINTKLYIKLFTFISENNKIKLIISMAALYICIIFLSYPREFHMLCTLFF